MTNSINSRLFSDKDLVRIIVPLIIEQFFVILVGMVDTIMVANVGEAAVSGISLMDQVSILFIHMFTALGTGGAVVVSQLIGAKKLNDACRGTNQLLYVCSFVSVVITALMLLFYKGVIGLFYGSLDVDVYSYAVTYIKITALSYPFIALYNASTAIFRAMGNSKISMLMSFTMNIINVIGNYLLIFVFHMGVTGAAVSTLVARVVGCVVVVLLLTNQNNLVHLDFESKKIFDSTLIKKILYIGIPNGFENSFFQLGKLIVSGIIAYFGTVQITANAVASNFAGFGCIPGHALGVAMITVIGRCVGAKDEEQVHYYVKKLMLISFAVCAVSHISTFILMNPVLKIYNLSAETQELTITLILMHNILAIFLWPQSFTFPNILRSVNDAKYTMYVASFSMVAFRIALSYILGLWMGLGVIGVWTAMICDWVFRGALFVYRYKSNKWKVGLFT